MTAQPHLPAVPDAPADATSPLRSQTTEALAFAFGYVAARPVTADQFGGVCALVDELETRHAYAPLLAALPPALAKAVQTLVWAHRGQRWARTGQYRPSK
jgi:hypothetical protein